MPDTFYSTDHFNFVWDENKNAKNIRKHGISFDVALHVFDDELRLEYLDVDHSDNELRFLTIGVVHDMLAVIYCERDNCASENPDIRIISARLATKLERNAYNNNIIGHY